MIQICLLLNNNQLFNSFFNMTKTTIVKFRVLRNAVRPLPSGDWRHERLRKAIQAIRCRCTSPPLPCRLPPPLTFTQRGSFMNVLPLLKEQCPEIFAPQFFKSINNSGFLLPNSCFPLNINLFEFYKFGLSSVICTEES